MYNSLPLLCSTFLKLNIMLTTSFKNYDEFQELFVRNKENGNIVRKNGVLLAFIKSKQVRKYLKDNEYAYGYKIGAFSNMAILYQACMSMLVHENANQAASSGENWYSLAMTDAYIFYSRTYRTDGHNGICVDGDTAGYRYQNMEREGRVFKMKVGRMLRHVIDNSPLAEVFPESVKLWLCEELTRQWEAYASSKIPSDLVLHVDDDFCSIYDGYGKTRSCDGYFHSCMQGSGHQNWKFYRDSVKAKAAYLTRGVDGDGMKAPIVARCIIFTDVEREDTGEIIRIAERQYSKDGDEVLQRILIQKLKEGGYIDAYKKTGAGCGDATAFVDIKGNDMSDVELSIDCDLDCGDHISYQDSFKYYNMDEERAYNHYVSGCEGLDTTDDTFDEDTVYSEYHGRDIPEDESTYVETRDDYFWSDECVDAMVWSNYDGRFYWQSCFEDDCIEIDGDYYYAGEDAGDPESNNIQRCPHCGEWFVVDKGNAVYSDLTEEWYCSDECQSIEETTWYEDEGWTYAEYDNEWVEDEDEVTTRKDKWGCTETILKASMEFLNRESDYIWDEIGEIWIAKDYLYRLMDQAA